MEPVEEIFKGHFSPELRMMMHTNPDNSEIALQLNYSQTGNMGRDFRKELGFSPTNNGSLSAPKLRPAGSWQKIESGTDLPIQDISGAMNEKTGEHEILCVASDKYHNLGKKILEIKEGNTYPIQDEGLSWSLSSVWFVPARQYYIAGAGIYPKSDIDSPNPWVRYSPGTVTSYFTNRIRGNAINDVVAAGAFGEIVHSNGITWQNYFTETQLIPGAFYGLDMKNQVIVAVGEHGSNAAVAIGMR